MNLARYCSFFRMFLVLASFGVGGSMALAQRAIPEDLVVTPVLVTAGASTGSGFYLATEKGQVFVTAKHVLFDEKGGLRADKAHLLSYSLKRESGGTLIELDLKTLLQAKNLRSHESADVSVALIGTSNKPPTEQREIAPVAGVTLNRVAPEGIWGPPIAQTKKFEEVLVGNEVLVFGFPSSIGLAKLPQIDPLRPLMRKGIVAGRNEAQKTIIIEVPAFPGNSGGPVFQVDQTLVMKQFNVIGIVTQFVPFDNSGWSAALGGNATLLNSGFSVVLPIDRALELID